MHATKRSAHESERSVSVDEYTRLVLNAKQDPDTWLNAAVDKNIPMVYEYMRQERLEWGKWLSPLQMEVVYAIEDYDPDKGKWSHFLWTYIRNRHYTLLTRETRIRHGGNVQWGSFEEAMSVVSMPTSGACARMDVDELLRGLSDSDKLLLELRFEHGYVYREMGVMLGVSTSLAHWRTERALKRARAHLR
jgi:RNA polymerase sigma factor (sigma-70 family)